MNKSIYIILLLFGLGALHAADTRQQESSREMEVARQIEELMQQGKQEEAMQLYEDITRESFSGKLRVSGRVVDENGQALNDVTMEITRLEFDSLGSTELKESNETQTINGTFKYACDECAGADLEFKKDGYYRDKIELITYAFDVPNRELIQDEIEISLIKIGERIVPERYEGHLKVASRGKDVLSFSFGQTGRAIPYEAIEEVAERRGYEGDVQYLELKVKRDADMQILVQEVARSGGRHMFKKPVDPILDFTSANGGIILYEPKNKKVRKIDLEMWRAPTTGYEPTLMLDVTSDKTQYFYCRIGNRYGRGSLNPVRLNRNADGSYASASVHVAIRLNPTPGDTNLEFW